MLAAEWVVDDCQILLTTSLLDEGINLHNDNLGFVHLIGDVHSGELRQFLGRFRQSNPELLLHIAGLPEIAPIDLVQERDSLLAFQHKTVEACQALVAHAPPPRLSSSASSVITLVKGLNASYQRFCQFDPLIARIQPTGAVEVRPNRPGLLAYLYQLDALNHYVSLTTLVERLEQQLVHCEIQHCRINALAPDQVVEQDLRTAAQVVEKERLALIKKIEKRLARAVATGCFTNPLDALENLVTTVARDNTLESSMWRLFWELASQVAVDEQTALTMLRANHQRQVWRFVKGLDDVLIRAFHQALVACRAEYAPDSDDPLEIPRSYAQTLVLDTLAQVAQRDPHYQVSAQLSGSKKRGVHCDATGCFEVTPQFVTKLFRDYTHSDIGRQFYRYYSLAWGGYQYRALCAPTLTTAVMPTRRQAPG